MGGGCKEWGVLRSAVTTGLGRGGWGSYGIIRRWEGHGMEGQPMGYRDSPRDHQEMGTLWDIGTPHRI